MVISKNVYFVILKFDICAIINLTLRSHTECVASIPIVKIHGNLI